MNEQQLLPTIDPSENDLIERALAMPLERKIEKAINLLKCWEDDALRKDPENGYQLGFSGGKDSCVIKQLAIESGVKFKATYNNVTIDPPELVYFIKKHHPDVEWKSSGRGHLILKRMVEKMIMPTRMFRWCCQEYKECCSKCDTVSVVGVRIVESAKRAKRWRDVTFHSETKKMIVAPIVYWTDADVWNFIKSRNLPYCCLYDEGWSRLGCVGCPLNSKSQAREFERWPKYKAMWMEGARRIWIRSQTVKTNNGDFYAANKYDSPEALFEMWMNEVKKEPEQNCVFEEMMSNT
jgi:phosphoadenosine phosphosulfate reductase